MPRDTETVIHPIDQFLGERVRVRRKKLGLSQTALGKLVGLSFQQIQKYEQGANRIPASKLYELAEVLQVPVSFFYEGVERYRETLVKQSGLSKLSTLRRTALSVWLVSSDPEDMQQLSEMIGASPTATEVTQIAHIDQLSTKLRDTKQQLVSQLPDVILACGQIKAQKGFQIIREVKRDRMLREVPIIVMTDLLAADDMHQAYQAYVSAYMIKHTDERKLSKSLNAMLAFWADAVILPSMEE